MHLLCHDDDEKEAAIQMNNITLYLSALLIVYPHGFDTFDLQKSMVE